LKAGTPPLGDFLAEVCEVGPDVKSRLADLWRVYQRYAERSGERPMPKRTFAKRLEEKGFCRFRNDGVWHHGVCPKSGLSDFQSENAI
jgi:phage/plasmid-associated DNA primase